jgi:FkbM family methyltransferase
MSDTDRRGADVLLELSPPPDDPIRLLDVGCSSGMQSTWNGLRGVIDYVGCDPLVGDCDRRAPEAEGFPRLRRLGVAVAANEGVATLHVAADPDCSSLLLPNWPVVSRFNYAWRFASQEEREVSCTTLAALARQHGQPDAIKLDSQGMEYQLISSSLDVVAEALCVEVEAGLVENYVGEYPYALIDPLLRQAGHSMVDFVALHSRRRAWGDAESRHQPLWCEVTWLRDVVGRRERPSPGQARKLLLICKALGHLAFGHELAGYLAETGVISPALGQLLADPASWRGCWRLGEWVLA